MCSTWSCRKRTLRSNLCYPNRAYSNCPNNMTLASLCMGMGPHTLCMTIWTSSKILRLSPAPLLVLSPTVLWLECSPSSLDFGLGLVGLLVGLLVCRLAGVLMFDFMFMINRFLMHLVVMSILPVNMTSLMARMYIYPSRIIRPPILNHWYRYWE